MMTNARWEPGIGDPTVFGWVTVLAYGVAMLLCYGCYRKAVPGPARRFWLLMAFIMLALGVNKQLDLQTWLTQVGRDVALEHGWYARRRLVQVVFIVWLVLVALMVRTKLLQLVQGLDRHARGAAMGLLLLGVFVLVRAASFHHVDVLLGLSLEGLPVNAVLELGGIGMIAWAAFACWRSRPGLT